MDYSRQRRRPMSEEFVTRVRTAIHSPETMRAIEDLIAPHVDAHGPTLAYILPQTSRIGHFITEMQILETLFRPHYARIVVITEPMAKPGTNPWLRHLFDDAYRFVETDQQVIHFAGVLRDDGIVAGNNFDLLLWKPALIHVEFFRRLVQGVTPARLSPSPEIIARAEADLHRRGVDLDMPLVLLHVRTGDYLANLTHNRHRTTTPALYGQAVSQLLSAGYQVIRIGEPGLDIGVADRHYHDRPAWTDSEGYLDLYLAARCAFAVMQDSGPVWAVNAMGRKAIRLNCVHVYGNYNYLDDPNLFKRYRRRDSAEFLTYREAMAANLPLLTTQAQIDDAGLEMVEHDSETIVAAVAEMIAHVEHGTTPSSALRLRQRQIAMTLENRMRRMPAWADRHLDFYGMAHNKGWVSSAMQTAQPNFWE